MTGPFSRDQLTPRERSGIGTADPVGQTRDKHKISVVGDSDLPVDACRVVTKEPQQNLGATGRFADPDIGVVQAKYVRFGAVDSGSGPAVFADKSMPEGLQVTNVAPSASDSQVLGVVASDQPVQADEYGWVIDTGLNPWDIEVEGAKPKAGDLVRLKSDGAYSLTEGTPVARVVDPSKIAEGESGLTVKRGGILFQTDMLSAQSHLSDRIGEVEARSKSILRDIGKLGVGRVTKADIDSLIDRLSLLLGEDIRRVERATYRIDESIRSITDDSVAIERQQLLAAVANFKRQAESFATNAAGDANTVTYLAAAVNQLVDTARVYQDEAGVYAESATVQANLALVSRHESNEFALASAERASEAEGFAGDAETSAQASQADRVRAEAARDDAEGSAGAAATHEQNAAAFATDSEQSAQASQADRVLAQTARAGAEAAEGRTATSESNAAGSAASAEDFAQLAAESEALSASRVMLTPNGEFTEGLLGWRGTYNQVGAAAANFTPVGTSGREAIRSNTPQSREDFSSQTLTPARAGRTYRVTLVFMATGAAPAMNAMLVFHDSAGDFMAHKSARDSNPTVGDWQTLTHEYTVQESDGFHYVRAASITNHDSNAAVTRIDIDALYVEDITESKSAGLSAAQALASEGRSATSETNAAGSAASAEADALLAVQAKNQSESFADASESSKVGADAALASATTQANLSAKYSTQYLTPSHAAENMWYGGVDPAVSSFKTTAVNAEGRYILLEDVDDSMYPVGAQPALDDQRYRVRALWEKSGSGSDPVAQVWIRWYRADGSYLTGDALGLMTATSFDPHEVEFTSGVVTRPTDAAFYRMGIKRLSNDTFAFLLVFSLQTVQVTERLAAEAQADIATTQAATATAEAAKALTNYELTARLATAALNPNPDMRLWSTTGLMLPERWEAYGSSSSGVTSRTRVSVTGRDGIRFEVRDLTQNTGIYQHNSTDGINYISPGAYVLELDIRADGSVGVPSGQQWKGVGLGAWWMNSAGTVLATHTLAPAVDPLPNGEMAAWDGSQIQSLRKLVYAPANTRKLNLYLFANHSGTGGGFPAGSERDFDVYRAALRPATAEEVAANLALPALEATVQDMRGAAADSSGNVAAFIKLLVAASGGNPAMFELLAGAGGSGIGLVADVIALGNSIDGIVQEVLRVEDGVAKIDGALLRNALVAPTQNSEIFHPVQLKPLTFLASDDEYVQYQTGDSYGTTPDRIEADISKLPALAEGETYYVVATGITSTGFTAKVKKRTAAPIVLRTGTNSGSFGSTPQYRINKPTSDDAYDGNYEYKISVTLPKTFQFTDSENGDTVAEYGGSFEFYGYNSAGNWVKLSTQTITGTVRTQGTPPTAYNANNRLIVVNSQVDLGGGGNIMGVHPLGGASIQTLHTLRYSTQSGFTETAVSGNVPFLVYPPTS